MGISNSRPPELLEVLATGEPAAFATDSRERVVFWNRGAAALLGRRAEEAMGRHCYEVLGGRDVFGNRFCYANCPIAAMSRSGEAPGAFELRVPGDGSGGAPTTIHVTPLCQPGPRGDLFTLVHIIHPVDEQVRLSRTLERLAPGAGSMVAGAATVGMLPPRRFESFGGLTARECEVLGWVARGLANKEIAEKLALSRATVRNHVHNTLTKLEVHSKLEAVSLAFRKGWVRQDDAAGQG